MQASVQIFPSGCIFTCCGAQAMQEIMYMVYMFRMSNKSCRQVWCAGKSGADRTHRQCVFLQIRLASLLYVAVSVIGAAANLQPLALLHINSSVHVHDNVGACSSLVVSNDYMSTAAEVYLSLTVHMDELTRALSSCLGNRKFVRWHCQNARVRADASVAKQDGAEEIVPWRLAREANHVCSFHVLWVQRHLETISMSLQFVSEDMPRLERLQPVRIQDFVSVSLGAVPSWTRQHWLHTHWFRRLLLTTPMEEEVRFVHGGIVREDSIWNASHVAEHTSIEIERAPYALHPGAEYVDKLHTALRV